MQFERWKQFRAKGCQVNTYQCRKYHKEFEIMKEYMQGVKTNKLAKKFSVES